MKKTLLFVIIPVIAIILVVVYKSLTGITSLSLNNNALKTDNTSTVNGYSTDNSQPVTSATPSPSPTAEVSGAATLKTNEPVVTMDTSFGVIKIQLFEDTMPITAGNFDKLVSAKFYNGVIFHRVINGFMIQGGDPTGTGTGGPGYTIKDEVNPNNHNLRGTVAMANAGPNTGGSQFFINLVDNKGLDTQPPNAYYPVFGKVIAGMDVVDKIAKVQTDSSDRPVIDVKINSATIAAN